MTTQRLYECQVHLTRARVLLRTEGEKASNAIEASLAEARAAARNKGQGGWEPFVHEERAELARLLGDDASRRRELREAHRLFTEVDATGHAARLAKELGL